MGFVSAGRLTAATCCALALAGCGGGGARPVHRRAGDAPTIAYAGCMRAHGVRGFPDDGAARVASLKPAMRKTPAFIAAETVCASVAPSASSLHKVTDSEKRRLLAAARCMRSHGAGNVPDPSFGAGGAVILDDSGTGNQAPAFRQAAARCNYPVVG